MTIKEKLAGLGLTLPPFTPPMANYVCASRCGKLVLSAGNTPKVNGVLQYTGHLSSARVEEGYQAARLCTLNALAVLDDLCGGLDNIDHIVKVTGYINSEEDFFDQPKVLNGASDLLVQLFGEKGRHARCALGMFTLGGNAMCEITYDVALKDETLAKI